MRVRLSVIRTVAGFLTPKAFDSIAQGRRASGASWAVVWNRVAVQCMALVYAAAVGCHDDMYNQPRYEALEASDFFDDGRSARPLVPGTVPYGALPADDVLFTGRSGGELVAELPIELSEALLRRGQERFNIYCSVCHDRSGDGNGMIVQRGYRQPPTYHSDRLRGAPIGHFFDVMTNGFGAMPSYSLQVAPEDRWAIAAYIRALQLSHFARGEDIPEDVRIELDSAPAPSKVGARGGIDGSGETNRRSLAVDPRLSTLAEIDAPSQDGSAIYSGTKTTGNVQ